MAVGAIGFFHIIPTGQLSLFFQVLSIPVAEVLPVIENLVLPDLGPGHGFHQVQGYGHFGASHYLGVELRVVELLAGQVSVLFQKRHPLFGGEHGGFALEVRFAVGGFIRGEIAQFERLAGLRKGKKWHQE